jgi:hypothetical protein
MASNMLVLKGEPPRERPNQMLKVLILGSFVPFDMASKTSKRSSTSYKLITLQAFAMVKLLSANSFQSLGKIDFE